MKDKILHHSLRQTGLPNLSEILSEQLPGSALNSLLLDTFHRRASQFQPADVLRAYAGNRFVKPSNSPFFRLLEIKNDLLYRAAAAGFEPLQLSPVSPLGTCSAVGLVHQDKVLTAIRGTEVVADATNVLALESALRRRPPSQPRKTLRFCTIHRHMRTPTLKSEGHTQHFDVFCMTSAGQDEGNSTFEATTLAEHLHFYHAWAGSLSGASGFRAVVTPFGEAGSYFCQHILAGIVGDAFPTTIKSAEPAGYYRFLRCKLLLELQGQTFEIGDCGFTDWTARLLSDRKQRFFISGMGVELVAKFCVGE